MEINLRNYQQQAINKARYKFASGKKSVCLVLPCRAGKSVIAAYMAKRNTDMQKHVLVLIHRIELKEQLEETFKKFDIDMNFCDVYMVQSFFKNKENIYKKYKLIITDEGHHGLCKTYKKIYDFYPEAFKIFFTATPVRLDGRGLDDICDDLVVGVTSNWLMENRYLSKYKYYAPSLEDFSNCQIKRGDYVQEEVFEKLNKTKIYGDILKHYNKLCNGKQAIAYCASVEHSKLVCKEFNDNGIRAAHIDGTTSSQERKNIMEDFRKGKIRILCNYEIVGEGLDVPDCEVCLLLRATASLCLYIQMACRCLTYKANKEAIILDFVGNYTRFGMPTADRQWVLHGKIDDYENEDDDGSFKIRVCKNCFSTFEKADECPYCGAEYEVTKAELQNYKNIELKEIEEAQALRLQRIRDNVYKKVSTYSSPQECKSWMELVQWVKLKGYKPGYAFILNKKLGFNYKPYSSRK